MTSIQELSQKHFSGLTAYENKEQFPNQTFWFNTSEQYICGYDSNFKNIFKIRWGVWLSFIEELKVEYHQAKDMLTPIVKANFDIDKLISNDKKRIMTSWIGSTFTIINIESVTISDDEQFTIEEAFKLGQLTPVPNPDIQITNSK